MSARGLLAAAALVLAGAAEADSVLEFSLDTGGKTERQIAYVAGGVVAMSGAGGTDQDVVFDTRAGTMTIVHHRDRTFMRLDRARVEALAESARAMMQAVRAQLERQLSGLTPEQREAVLSSMGGLAGLGSTGEPEAVDKRIDASGERRRVAGIECAVHVVRKNDRAVAETCVADAGALDLPAEDVEAVRAMQVFGDRMASELSQIIGGSAAAMPEIGAAGYDGIAIAITDLDGDPPTRIVLEGARQDEVPASRVSVPPGYREQPLPEIPGLTR